MRMASCASCRKADIGSSSAPIEQICYNADFRRERRPHRAVRDRARRVSASSAGLQLIEIAPGIDIERDILAHMDFKPAIAKSIKTMDKRLFLPPLMGMKVDIASRERVKRSR